MAEKTIDIGDGIKRPISFKMSYAKMLIEKYGNIDKMMNPATLTSVIPELIHEGLKDKAGLTPETIADAIDSDRQYPLISDLWHAISGLRVDFLALQQQGVDSLLKNAPTDQEKP